MVCDVGVPFVKYTLVNVCGENEMKWLFCQYITPLILLPLEYDD